MVEKSKTDFFVCVSILFVCKIRFRFVNWFFCICSHELHLLFPYFSRTFSLLFTYFFRTLLYFFSYFFITFSVLFPFFPLFFAKYFLKNQKYKFFLLARAIHREHFLLHCLKKQIATAKELDLRQLGKVLIFRDRQLLLYINHHGHHHRHHHLQVLWTHNNLDLGVSQRGGIAIVTEKRRRTSNIMIARSSSSPSSCRILLTSRW